MSKKDFNPADFRILEALLANPALTAQELSEQLNISKEESLSRLQVMKESGIIQPKLGINYENLGLSFSGHLLIQSMEVVADQIKQRLKDSKLTYHVMELNDENFFGVMWMIVSVYSDSKDELNDEARAVMKDLDVMQFFTFKKLNTTERIHF